MEQLLDSMVEIVLKCLAGMLHTILESLWSFSK